MSSIIGNARFAMGFATLTVAFVAIGAIWRQFALALLWPTVTCSILAVGYAGLVHNVFGKMPNGRLRLLNTICLLPYLCIYWMVWHVRTWLDQSECCHEISQGLFIGRRLTGHESPPNEIGLVVDLTSEFAEPNQLRCSPNYLSLPILDGGGVSLADILKTVSKITTFEGPTLIHCAEGNGRSVMVAIAVLFASGNADDISEALAMIRSHRPAAHLRSPQRLLLEIACRELGNQGSLQPEVSSLK